MAERDPSLPAARPSQVAYEADYAAWLAHQVELLKADRWSEVDKDHLIDEVESLSRSEFRSFVSAIRIVLLHMLKWDLQSDFRSRSWAVSIEGRRLQIFQELEDSPSYATRRDEAVEKAYKRARFEAAQETQLPLQMFPDTCPYDWDAIVGREHRLDREPDPRFNT